MDKATAKKVRDVLYAEGAYKGRPTNKELEVYYNIDSVAQIKTNSLSGRASLYPILRMKWQFDEVCDVTNDAEEILAITAKEPTVKQLATFSGESPAYINLLRYNRRNKEGSYGFDFRLWPYYIEKVAELAQ